MHQEIEFGRQQKLGEGSSKHVKRQQLEFFHIKMQALGPKTSMKRQTETLL
jgi:hypothetical protein